MANWLLFHSKDNPLSGKRFKQFMLDMLDMLDKYSCYYIAIFCWGGDSLNVNKGIRYQNKVSFWYVFCCPCTKQTLLYAHERTSSQKQKQNTTFHWGTMMRACYTQYCLIETKRHYDHAFDMAKLQQVSGFHCVPIPGQNTGTADIICGENFCKNISLPSPAQARGPLRGGRQSRRITTDTHKHMTENFTSPNERLGQQLMSV